MQITDHHSENGKTYTELVFADDTSMFMTAEHYAELSVWLGEVRKRQAESDADIVDSITED